MLLWTTAQDVSKSILSTAGLQRPAKRKSDCEHVTGSDATVINRRHSDINLLVQKKITKKKKKKKKNLGARAYVLAENQTVDIPKYKPHALLLS